MRALDISATGMTAQQYNIDVIANNLANGNTVGFKEQHATFEDLIYQTITRAGANVGEDEQQLPVGIQFGLGTRLSSTFRDVSQGALEATPSAELNVAINGRGFFSVTLPNGDTAYTRDGNFARNSDGTIVTTGGLVVSPGITIPIDATNITISSDGQVQAVIPSQIDPEILGTLELVNFINPAGLDAYGSNIYTETAASGEPIIGVANDEGFGTIVQYFLESSNVNTIKSVTDLIKAQKVFEMNAKVIESVEKLLQSIVNIRT
jgi:flagellar basal-body rod protein FlgG